MIQISNNYNKLNESFYLTFKELSTVREGEIHRVRSVPQQRLIQESIGVLFIVSVLLATPSVIEKLAKAFQFVINKLRSLFNKEEQEDRVFQALTNLMDKWHHAYIKSIQGLLTISGVYKAAGIDKEDKESREKVAKVVFYLIIFGFAVYGGILSTTYMWEMISESSMSHLDMVTAKSVLTYLKSEEVANFMKEII